MQQLLRHTLLLHVLGVVWMGGTSDTWCCWTGVCACVCLCERKGLGGGVVNVGLHVCVHVCVSLCCVCVCVTVCVSVWVCARALGQKEVLSVEMECFP